MLDINSWLGASNTLNPVIQVGITSTLRKLVTLVKIHRRSEKAKLLQNNNSDIIQRLKVVASVQHIHDIQ